MNRAEWIDQTLAQIRREGLERRALPRTVLDKESEAGPMLDFSSNDYLNLSRSPAVIARSEEELRRWGAGAGASRLLSGTLPCHDELERKIAAFKGYPAALVFGSGYTANAGIIPVAAGRGDYVLADKLAHASIIDAAILSRAELLRFRHNDAGHLEELLKRIPAGRRCLIVTESVFSMDGDTAPLAEIAELARRHGAMFMVDEAHATGIFGPKCAGLVTEAHLENAVALCMGTLSKAFGAYGGFVACSENTRSLLVNRSRSFIFSTAMPPAVVGAALGALAQIQAHPEWGRELLIRADRFRTMLKDAGLDTGYSRSQIIPVIIGGNRETLSLADRLRKKGILAIAVRPPTVPEGTARLRLSVTLAHSPQDLEHAARIIIETAKSEAVL
jgi:8-amino-7-oxononanoate synthase